MAYKPPIHSDDHRPFGSDAVEDLRWYYAIPVAPATEPDDYVAGDGMYVTFDSPWENIASDRPATAYTLSLGGKPRLRLCVTGGEGVPGSTVLTLPEPFRPVVMQRITGVAGSSGEAIAVFDVDTDGVVTFIGVTTVTTNGNFINYDVNVGESLSIETTTTFGVLSHGALTITGDDDITVKIGTVGKSLTILDSSDNPIFRIDEDGTPHIKNGMTWQDDL